LIEQKFQKNISYAQIAYEMSKRQKPVAEKESSSLGKRVVVADAKL
jgi:hypothetical protein